MVMQPGPVVEAYEALSARIGKRPRVIYMTPQGRVFTQKIAEELAREEELTPRQRQIMRMRYSRNMSVTRIAQELGINKATVSRTLSRSTWKLYRSLRYSL